MRQERIGPTLVAMESHGKIVAIGGWDGGFASLNSVEVYDVETNQWSVANPMVPADICLSSLTLSFLDAATDGGSRSCLG